MSRVKRIFRQLRPVQDLHPLGPAVVIASHDHDGLLSLEGEVQSPQDQHREQTDQADAAKAAWASNSSCHRPHHSGFKCAETVAIVSGPVSGTPIDKS